MTVNWPEGSVTVIHFPWADLGRLPPPAASTRSPETSTPNKNAHLSAVSHRFNQWTLAVEEKQNDYIASDLIITSSLLFILW